MTYVESTRPIVTTNLGRPDYSGETWQAKVIKRLELHENETFKTFFIATSLFASPFVWVVPPIAVGVPTYLIDQDTGFPMPYVLAAGYTIEVMMIWSSFNQNQRIFSEYEGFQMTEYYNDALVVYYENEVLEFTTKYDDPDAIFPHLIGFGGENVGLDVMRGAAEVCAILHRVHTEIPTAKTIRCKWCGNTTSVSHTTTKWNCTKCGKLNLYFTMPRSIVPKEIK
jgi:ribosomal protein S27AE